MRLAQVSEHDPPAIIVCVALGLTACDKAKPEVAVSTNGFNQLITANQGKAQQMDEEAADKVAPPRALLPTLPRRRGDTSLLQASTFTNGRGRHGARSRSMRTRRNDRGDRPVGSPKLDRQPSGRADA